MLERTVDAAPPIRLKRFLNNVSSVLTVRKLLTIGQFDAKIKVQMSRKCIMLVLLVVSAVSAFSQKIVDKTVATVSDGIRTELITLSDLRWQLALQKGINLNPASSEDLNAALRLLVDQRIFTLEANRLPRETVSEKEIESKIKEIMDANGVSAAEFESRLRQVGFTSINDDNFEQIIADRVAIDKYLAFRFRSFIVITANDEAKYYREVFVPEFRRKYPGLLMPTLEEIGRASCRERV